MDQFTSGIFNRGIEAWHQLGTVVDDETLTPLAAFTEAKALFPVQKKPLFYNWSSIEGEGDPRPSKRSALVHGITGEELGTCGSGYEIVPNSKLLEMAEAVSEHILMDAVIVLDGGRKVCFTGLIKAGGVQDVLPNDPVSRFLVGYLGHDGATGISAGFGNIRVVCRNTLAAHMDSATSQRTLAHRKGVGIEVDRLISSINVQQRTFEDDIEAYKVMAERRLLGSEFKDVLTDLYAKELANPIKEKGVIVRERRLSDLSVYEPMLNALESGLGTDIPGVRGTHWAAFNAITEVLTSQLAGAQNNIRRFDRAFFGINRARIARAKELILALR